MRVKTYQTPPQLYLGFQPHNLPQYPPYKALKRGTLWPSLHAPYPPVDNIDSFYRGEGTDNE
jgi:spore coat protein JA